MDTLHGCTKCRFNQTGCGACRDAPIMERPKSVRWKPDAARPQTSVPSAPTFYPTAEEFTDPVAYINKIRPEGEKCAPALCCCVSARLPLFLDSSLPGSGRSPWVSLKKEADYRV